MDLDRLFLRGRGKVGFLLLSVLVAGLWLAALGMGSAKTPPGDEEVSFSFPLTDGLELLISTRGDYRPLRKMKLFVFEYGVPLSFRVRAEEGRSFPGLRVFVDFGDGEGVWLSGEQLGEPLTHTFGASGLSRPCYPLAVVATWKEGESEHLAYRSVLLGTFWFGDDEPTFASTLAPPASSDDPVVDAVLAKLHREQAASPACQPASD